MKECSNCHTSKDESEFYRDRRIKHRVAYLARCKTCTDLFNTPYRTKNRDYLNECARRRRAENREAVNKKNRESYYRNREARRKNQKKYEAFIREAMRTDKVWHSKELASSARRRARRYGVPFSITYQDVIIPDYCPALGIKLERNKEKMSRNSATLDRIIPDLGYVPGNVVVISNKANNIKNDATADEILAVGNYFKRMQNDS
jgi:hypothetical protein